MFNQRQLRKYRKNRNLKCDLIIGDDIVCNLLIKDHPKCPYCSRLLHEEKETDRDACCDLKKIMSTIKDHCVLCGNPIPATLEHFLERGNWCSRCNAEAGRYCKRS